MPEMRYVPYPHAVNDPVDLSRVTPARVVGLGALCDLRPELPDDPRSRSFSVAEFVTLEDGRRVTLHRDRGLTIGWRSTDPSEPIRIHATLEQMARSVLNTVLPDDDSGEEHPWSWLAGLARARGLDVTADDLRRLPYEVVFTERVHRSVICADGY